MAGFAEADKVLIRQYMGFSSLWKQTDPRLENAILSVQAIADGGQRDDNSTQNLVLAIIAKLQTLDNQIDALATFVGVTDADKGDAKIDAARETLRLQARARAYVHRLARILDTEPRSDAFAPASEFEQSYLAYPFGGRSGY